MTNLETNVDTGGSAELDSDQETDDDHGIVDSDVASGSLAAGERRTQRLTVRLLETGPVRLVLEKTVVDEFEVRPRSDAGGSGSAVSDPVRSAEPSVETGGEAIIYVETEDGR